MCSIWSSPGEKCNSSAFWSDAKKTQYYKFATGCCKYCGFIVVLFINFAVLKCNLIIYRAMQDIQRYWHVQLALKWDCQCCSCTLVEGPRCPNCCNRQKNTIKKVDKGGGGFVKWQGGSLYLLSSNLLALCFSRLRIQMSSDTPDNDAAPPAAKPDATATAGVGEAGESQKKVLLVLPFNASIIVLVLGSGGFTSAGGFLRSPVAMDATGHKVDSFQGELFITLKGALGVECWLSVQAADVAVFGSFKQWARHSCRGKTARVWVTQEDGQMKNEACVMCTWGSAEFAVSFYN